MGQNRVIYSGYIHKVFSRSPPSPSSIPRFPSLYAWCVCICICMYNSIYIDTSHMVNVYHIYIFDVYTNIFLMNTFVPTLLQHNTHFQRVVCDPSEIFQLDKKGDDVMKWVKLRSKTFLGQKETVKSFVLLIFCLLLLFKGSECSFTVSKKGKSEINHIKLIWKIL